MKNGSHDPTLETLFHEARQLARQGAPSDETEAFLGRFLVYCQPRVGEAGAADRTEGALLSFLPLFRKMELFKSLDDPLLLKILLKMRLERCLAGDRVIRRGQSGDSLYIVLQGRWQLDRSEDESTCDEIFFGPGEIVGEMALVTGLPRAADVFAVEESLAARLSKDLFEQLCSENPEAMNLLTSLVGSRLGEASLKRAPVKVGQYRILSPLGSGGASVVFKASHETLGREVALKMLPHRMLLDRVVVDDFIREARLVCQLDHPNIVRLFEIIQDYGTYFMVLEFVDGESLASLLAREKRLELNVLVDLLDQVAPALAHAWARGVVHQDLKPSNIMVGRDGKMKLLDFGAAISRDLIGSSTTGDRVCGTLGYMSPEQSEGKKPDFRGDIYSFGVMLYQLLVGSLPFSGSTILGIYIRQVNNPAPRPADLRPDLPGWLDSFVVACLAPRRDDRLASFDGILSLVKKIKAGKISPDGRLQLHGQDSTSGPDFDRSRLLAGASSILSLSSSRAWRKRVPSAGWALTSLLLMALSSLVTYLWLVPRG